MPDNVDASTRSRIMGRVKSTGTKPELSVRRALHAAGFRFRLHDAKLPGKPDIVLPRYRTVVFVNGCQWHWHGCKRSRMPATNRDYWEAKIARNVARDRTNLAKLETLGWDCQIVWECQLGQDIEDLLEKLSHHRKTGLPV